MNNIKAKQIKHKFNLDLERLNVHTHHGCNLRCHGCSHHSDVVSPSSYVEDETQLLKDLDYITNHLKIHHVSVLGGEPLLNPKFTKQVCELLIYKNQFTKLVTNGTLILKNKDWIIDLLKKGMLLKISVHLMPTRDRNSIKILNEINNFIDEAQKYNITCDAESSYSQNNLIGGHIVMEDSWRTPWDTFFKYEPSPHRIPTTYIQKNKDNAIGILLTVLGLKKNIQIPKKNTDTHAAKVFKGDKPVIVGSSV